MVTINLRALGLDPIDFLYADEIAPGTAEAFALSALSSSSAASASALAAGVSETNAANYAAKLTGTSSTSADISVSSKSFVTQAEKFFDEGNWVLIVSDSNPTINYMIGQVTSYSGTALTVNVTYTNGTGTHTDWIIRLSGADSSPATAIDRAATTADAITALTQANNASISASNAAISEANSLNYFIQQTLGALNNPNGDYITDPDWGSIIVLSNPFTNENIADRRTDMSQNTGTLDWGATLV